uniref:Saccharopine dehydrogenase NADP binding domain-containing protein n=2 Tax=Alexandrium catenella TaxID=2925 RepID=A0A7S1LNA7_ALECA|mmetsp:Transcript_117140/g.311536  ORF Transcript_117140/g.311536 Transcript_117140/m.311536 type:complete len:643 (+) Transcript_117140:64-1992(+)
MVASTSAPVYGLSCDLPAGLLLSSDVQFAPVPKAERLQESIGIQRQPRPSRGTSALVKKRTESSTEEEVLVDGKYGPIVDKVGGGSDHVRMGLPLPGFQRKWWFDASATEREVSVIQAAKVSQSRRDIKPPPSETGDFDFFNKSAKDRLNSGMAELPSAPRELPPAVQEASVYVPTARPERDPEPERPFDVVVYGATGFTGCLIVEHLDVLLADPKRRNLRWAIAGRNMDKLMAMAARCSSSPSVIMATSRNEVKSMAASCRVVIAAAGPYIVSGEAVVEACVEKSTHYVDVTGESLFVHNMIESYHALARNSGVMVVHCAGQIATPDDINCYLLVKRLGPLKWFREYWNSVDAVTGGTFQTSMTMLQELATASSLRVERDPFSLGGLRSCGVRPEDEDCTAAEKDEVVFPGTWLEPTYNSRPGSRIVRRTCALFEEAPSDGVVYGESLSVTIREPAASQKAAQKSAEDNTLPTSADAAALIASILKGQQERGEVPPPGQGPPPQLRSKHWSEIYAVAESEKGERAYVHYTGPQSYEVTAMASVNVALTLLEEPEAVKADERGGVVTPAFAMHGSTYVERLQERSFAKSSGKKMRFEVVSGTPPADKIKQGVTSRMRDFAELRGEMMAGALKAWDLPAIMGP